MSKTTDALAAQLDDKIIENFADIYLVEEALKKIEKKHALDHPDVIAGLATCADIASVQQRLIARPPAALAKGLAATLRRGSLRPSAELLVPVPRGVLYGLERLGWKRGLVTGGTFHQLVRELDGITTIEFEPGIYAGGGMAHDQRIESIVGSGKGSPRAMA